MTSRPLDKENPDRLYIVTGGRSSVDESSIDLVSLIVSECDPTPGMQSEHVRILRMCHSPTAVVEISAELGLPVSVVKILLCDLLDTGRITARHPSTAPVKEKLPDPATLKQVLLGLEKL
ncbi:DUF742 domain-containing protein [Actinoallomurus bryophytorum]|uniref:Uncharacterized protein DUF742 n=1 Tax=Actinoallomurus bryophytorum TaxID=1490222 RepID=A0A543CQQ4_9ACTN|nr:DUF742 domain-containing protein [Actinoallomurus bryophytorum]TQL99257.1 uncharacterized protein DUF742 [Actinoallomurus bryophytorum]